MKIKTPDISGTIGLPPEDIELIVKEISAFKEIEKALVFGSRAKGNYRQGSDVDICLKGDNLSIHHKASLSRAFISKQDLTPEERRIWLKEHPNPLSTKPNYVPKYVRASLED